VPAAESRFEEVKKVLDQAAGPEQDPGLIEGDIAGRVPQVAPVNESHWRCCWLAGTHPQQVRIWA
jgi:hypothetical protein